MNLTQTLRSTVNAEVSSVTNFNPPCAGIFLPAIRNKRINSQRIAPADSPAASGREHCCAYRLGSDGNGGCQPEPGPVCDAVASNEGEISENERMSEVFTS